MEWKNEDDKRVYYCLKESGRKTKLRIAVSTGIALDIVENVLKRLENANLITKTPIRRGKIGRPQAVWSIVDKE